MNQPTLPGIDGGARFAAFCEYHRANPGIFELFRRFASEAKQAGCKHYGARAIGERIRWHVWIETDDGDFKINDHHWPYYARLLMLTDERFAGFFERRDNRFDVSDDTIRQELIDHA